jgi:antitoxin (DNA-binding transcriptional repressor) of toxin-antitoxin stability system
VSIGVLFVVATPIGNLKDITLRALETLREADVIAAEDTRQTSKLLLAHGIEKKSLVALHAHSSERAHEKLVERMVAGERVALVTDAGTPSARRLPHASRSFPFQDRAPCSRRSPRAASRTIPDFDSSDFCRAMEPRARVRSRSSRGLPSRS